MAIRNAFGYAVSYECEELIDELQDDIEEFGEDLVVEVVTEMMHGVKIYKDYNFLPEEKPDGNSFVLTMSERIEHIRAVDLLEIYREQDEVI